MLIYGINPVIEAIRAGRVSLVRVATRESDRLREVVREAERAGIGVERVPAAVLDRAARGTMHQGVVADLGEAERWSVADLIASANGPALVVVLDGIEDPHNVGAIIRVVDAAGASGIVRQMRHAAPLGGAVAKASAGALAHVKVADVVNVARAIEELKAAGVWTVGLAAGAPKRYEEHDLRLPTAIVVGAEGTGLRRLVRDRCDSLASIPMRGRVASLNASVAAGIVCFEAVRQRRG